MKSLRVHAGVWTLRLRCETIRTALVEKSKFTTLEPISLTFSLSLCVSVFASRETTWRFVFSRNTFLHNHHAESLTRRCFEKIYSVRSSSISNSLVALVSYPFLFLLNAPWYVHDVEGHVSPISSLSFLRFFKRSFVGHPIRSWQICLALRTI